MKSTFKILAVLTLLPVLGYGCVYALSENRLRSYAEFEPVELSIRQDSTTLERGRHVMRTRGCFGCHGQDLSGRVFTEEWDWVKRGVPVNLTTYLRDNSSTTFDTAVRRGVGRDGKALWTMPAYNWVHLTDEDMIAVLSYLSSLEPIENTLPRGQLGWKARWILATGKDDHMAAVALQVPPLIVGDSEEPIMAEGEYLAMTMCNECHGLDLRGEQRRDLSTPDLAIVAAYTTEDFAKLMTEGLGKGDRHLGLMTMIAKDRFPDLTASERMALHSFLGSLPGRPKPRGVPWRRE